MGFDIKKLAINSGFDDAHLVPGLFVENISAFGLYDLRQIMPKSKSVLLLMKKHKPYKSFPKDTMAVHSHYPAHQKAYFLHKNLIDKLNAMGVEAKSADMVPLKSYALYAGMSILKNSLICHKEFGSYFVLQAVALELESDNASLPSEDICKDCSKCIKACPTGAIGINGRLDKDKCIRNNVPVNGFIPEHLRALAKTSFIGCGICQAVCPYNSRVGETAPSKELCSALSLSGMLDLKSDNGQLKKLQVMIGKNEARPGRTIATSCLIAGNTKQKKYIPYLEAVLLHYINPLARGYAAWALGKIGGGKEVLEKALADEHNPDVKLEINSALERQ